MDFHLNGGLSPTNKGISAHTGMPFLIEREPQGYFLHLSKIFYGLKIYEMKTEKIIRLRVSLSLEFKAPELVKVKAYQRIRNGKVEKVRSHYRIVVGCKKQVFDQQFSEKLDSADFGKLVLHIVIDKAVMRQRAAASLLGA